MKRRATANNISGVRSPPTNAIGRRMTVSLNGKTFTKTAAM